MNPGTVGGGSRSGADAVRRARIAARGTALAAVLLLGACGGSGGDGGRAIDSPGRGDGSRPARFGNYVTAPGIETCSVDDLKARVDFDMRDYYVFASQVPDLSPAGFDSPDALIRGLRVAPDTFSSVSDAQDFAAQSEGRNVGFGFRLIEDERGLARFALVIGGSPAASAGLERGDVLLALDGDPVEELGPEGASARFDGAGEGDALRFTVRRGGREEPLDIDVIKAEYVIDTVAGTMAFDADDGTRVGYVPVLQFADTTADSLDDAFASLADEGVEALVLDLRYNPGGLIFAANRLAVHVAGDAVAGGTFVKYLYNETYARESNVDVPFETVDATLDLDRVVVVTTGGSASASELAVNGLRPYIDVRTVGSTTFGKAFGSTPRPYCDVVVNAMQFITANADEVTVAGGLEPDCAVEDEFEFPLGDPDDALTGAAYELLVEGTCAGDAPADPALAARELSRPAPTAIWDEMPRAPMMLDGR